MVSETSQESAGLAEMDLAHSPRAQLFQDAVVADDAQHAEILTPVGRKRSGVAEV